MSFFICVMVLISILSFCVRMFLVFYLGWADLIDSVLTACKYKVFIAILVPPAVDGLQSGLLILSSHLGASLHVDSTIGRRDENVDNQAVTRLTTFE
mmetsp:Transcript_126016/g.242936  ORF Transcript_126016/g.242936 Transcript_126016/m.242936 type:complete len:97 (+) Transcript_126016:2-292(+)